MMSKSEKQKGKISGGKGPGQESPGNKITEHQHNKSGRSYVDDSGKTHVYCTCGVDMTGE